MKKKNRSIKSAPKSYTIGRRAFAKISAVEGIRLTEDEDSTNSKELSIS